MRLKRPDDRREKDGEHGEAPKLSGSLRGRWKGQRYGRLPWLRKNRASTFVSPSAMVFPEAPFIVCVISDANLALKVGFAATFMTRGIANAIVKSFLDGGDP